MQTPASTTSTLVQDGEISGIFNKFWKEANEIVDSADIPSANKLDGLRARWSTAKEEVKTLFGQQGQLWNADSLEVRTLRGACTVVNTASLTNLDCSSDGQISDGHQGRATTEGIRYAHPAR